MREALGCLEKKTEMNICVKLSRKFIISERKYFLNDSVRSKKINIGRQQQLYITK